MNINFGTFCEYLEINIQNNLMKKIITLSLFLSICSILSTQEVGRAGSLIKNEANSSEMKTANRTIISNSNDKATSSNNRPNGNRVEGRNPSYQWNYTNGTSEVFLRIPERGYYTVHLDDQTISNQTGMYRFFDLRSGRNVLSIFRNGYLVYKATHQIENNMRVHLEFFEDIGLYFLNNYSLTNQNYNYNPFDNSRHNYSNSNGIVFIMNHRQFDVFLMDLKKNASFEDDKIVYIRQQMRVSMFSSEQIKTILST